MAIDLSNHPDKVTTNTTEDSLEICRRAEQHEFHIHAVNMGKTNSEWIYELVYPVQTQEQLL